MRIEKRILNIVKDIFQNRVQYTKKEINLLKNKLDLLEKRQPFSKWTKANCNNEESYAKSARSSHRNAKQIARCARKNHKNEKN